MSILVIAIQVLLGIGFFMFGFMKFTSKQMVEGFKHFGLPQWFRIVTGLVEWLGAAGMIIGIWFPKIALLSGILLAVTMFFAMLTHARAKDPASTMLMPAILLILSGVVTIVNI